MSNTPVRIPFTRVQTSSLDIADDNFQRLERNLNGVFRVRSLVFGMDATAYVLNGTEWLILCDCTAGAITLTFPLAARIDGAHLMVVKADASANAVTLSGTFNGVVNPTLGVQYQSKTINAGNGSYYFVPTLIPADIPSGTFPGNYVIAGTLDVHSRLTVTATTEQLRLAYDSTHYASLTVDSLGSLSIFAGPTGQGVFFHTPVQVGDGPISGSIALGVRQTTTTLTGNGQRGISSEPIFNSLAGVYTAAGHFEGVYDANGNVPYVVPNGYGVRVVTPVIPLVAGVPVATFTIDASSRQQYYMLYLYDAPASPASSYAIYTNGGYNSLGESLEVRDGQFKNTLGGVTGNNVTKNIAAFQTTGYYASGATTVGALDIAGEWAAGLFQPVAAFKLNMTDTSSATATLLADLQVGGTSKFAVRKDGVITVGSLAGNAGTATALQNARTIGGVSFNGTANITVSSATGAFTVGGLLTANAGAGALGIKAADGTILTFFDHVGPTEVLRAQATSGVFAMILQASGQSMEIRNSANTAIMAFDNLKNVAIGSAALGTTATDGFLYIPSCAGAPTGVPTAFSGRIPLVYDSTNNFLYIYNGGWKKSTVYA